MKEGAGASDLASRVVDSLGASPCLVALLIVVGGFLLFIHYQHKHLERMEQMRLDQYAKLVSGDKNVKK